MVTFKAVVYKHHKKEDGTYNVKIRIIHNREQRRIATTYFVTKEDLTKGLKIKNQAIVDELELLIKKYRNSCTALGERIKEFDVDRVVKFIENIDKDKKGFQLDMISYGREKIKELQAKGREGNAKTYNVMLNSLEDFLGRPLLDVAEVNVKFIKNYVSWLEAKPARPKREKGERAVGLYLSNLRALHNMAKADYNDEDSGIINIPFSPFKNYSVPKPPVTRKRAVSSDTIKAMTALPYEAVIQPGFNRFNLAKDIFLLSFGLVGMNTVDLYNCNTIKADRITYNRTKTRNRREDKAEISIRIEPQIMPLVEKYRDKTGKRVFNFYHHYVNADTFGTAVNRGLKKIGELDAIKVDDLEFYAARHSWATIAVNQVKIDKFTVHAALNHVSDEDMKVTDIYIDKDYSLIDEANSKLLKFIKFKLGSVQEPLYEKKKPPIKEV